MVILSERFGVILDTLSWPEVESLVIIYIKFFKFKTVFTVDNLSFPHYGKYCESQSNVYEF